MNTSVREAKMDKIKYLIKLLRDRAHEGHMSYVVDALETIVEILEAE